MLLIIMYSLWMDLEYGFEVEMKDFVKGKKSVIFINFFKINFFELVFRYCFICFYDVCRFYKIKEFI